MLVEKRTFEIPELLLQCGRRLRGVRIGYETYGQLNADKSNAILVAHYYTGTSHAAGRYRETDPEPGYWESLIGSGKAIDTDKYFVISADSLCNVNVKNTDVVTTGPASIDPETGRPYGANFPVVTIGDFVETQNLLCESLGIRKFHAVAGPSMGALQALEWAARYPEKVPRVIACISAGLSTEAYLIARLNTWCAPILVDPNFNGGEYYGKPEPVAGLTQALKLVTLDALHFGWARRLFKRRHADPDRDPLHGLDNKFSIETALETTAETRAKIADANSFLRLARAVQLFSIEDRKERLKARFLFLPARSDLLMFPDYAERGARELKELGLEVDSFVVEGDGGHLDGLHAMTQASEPIRHFLGR